MNNKTIYISLPKSISFSVFEATKLHGNQFTSLGYNVIYLTRNSEFVIENSLYFKNRLGLISFLKTKGNGILYGITVFEVLFGYIASIFNKRLKIFYWVQGLVDEEDYLSKKNRIRYYIFHKLIKVSLKISKKIVVVSEHMFKVLVSNYGCNPQKDYVVINCKSRVKYNGNKKTPNSLCYIGGLSKWQNVDKALSFFNLLCEESNKYTFYIATYNHVKAQKLINNNVKKKFRNKINLVNVKETKLVEVFLSKMEYGFLIRDNILLNNVASPIKLAEYLACGVNPIMSDSLIDYKDLILKYKAGIILSESESVSVQALLNNSPSIDNAINAYKASFEKQLTQL